MASNNKSPPSLSNSVIHRLIEIYKHLENVHTNLEPGKQGPAIVLSLEGEAQGMQQ